MSCCCLLGRLDDECGVLAPCLHIEATANTLLGPGTARSESLGRSGGGPARLGDCEERSLAGWAVIIADELAGVEVAAVSRASVMLADEAGTAMVPDTVSPSLSATSAAMMPLLFPGASFLSPPRPGRFLSGLAGLSGALPGADDGRLPSLLALFGSGLLDNEGVPGSTLELAGSSAPS